jgi:gliding motility-associated-like protein
MRKILIPLLACIFLCSATLLHAQVPESVKIPYPFESVVSERAPSAACNDTKAGTFTLGQFNGQSNDVALDTIFLCAGDSIFIDHNGDSDLTGDPDPATTPGIAWAFYKCKPTVTGLTLQTISADPCAILRPSNNLLTVFTGPQASGDTWFWNDGSLIAALGDNMPLVLNFAPITVDNFASNEYEAVQVGSAPGPCVNVNTAAAFQVVYLNPIEVPNVVTSIPGNSCMGRFKIRGGYPEFEKQDAVYTIDLSLKSDPSVKALIYTSKSQLRHNASILFTVPQPGVYTMTVTDGKSCDFSIDINMANCVSADNATIGFPDDNVAPGATICVPVTVKKFTDIIASTFSVQWDPNVLQYTGFQKVNPKAQPFSASNLNELQTGQGLLGIAFLPDPLSPITLPDSAVLIELCFRAVGQLGDCSQIDLINDPSAINLDNNKGTVLGLGSDPGRICIEFDPIQLTATFKDTTCLGTATLEVVVSGGIPPYEVQWMRLGSGGNTLGTIAAPGGKYTATGLNSGDYSICVIDQNGIGQMLCDTISLEVPVLTSSLNVIQIPTCNGSADGILMAAAALDGLPVANPGVDFTFAWSPSVLPQNVQEQTKLGAGTYIVTVTDKKTGCTAVASRGLNQPQAVRSKRITKVDSECVGVEEGSILYAAQGGTPLPGGVYDYEWAVKIGGSGAKTPVAANPNDSMLTDIGAGLYFVTITDANGCSFTDSLEINNRRVVNFQTVNIKPASCSYKLDGSIEVSISETPTIPNANYLFIWIDDDNDPVPNQTDTPRGSIVSGLRPGKYHLLAAETTLGCGDTISFTVTSPPAFKADTASFSNPTCTNPTSGAISISAAGGTGNPSTFKYAWTPATLPASSNVTGLAAGRYTVTATDANGCIDSLLFNLALPASPTITSTDSTPLKCGNDGCLSVSSSTATSFEWFTLAGVSVGKTAQICNLSSDTFVVVVKNAQNCVTRDTFSLAPLANALRLADTSLTLPSCFGNKDGRIIAAAQGGQPGYTYSWSTGQVGPLLTGIGAGKYGLKITDSKNCMVVDTFALSNPPDIVAVPDSIKPTLCSDTSNCTGKAIIFAKYDSGASGQFNFLWEDGDSDSMRVDLCTGTYKVTVTDGNNCFKITELVITGPPPITADSIQIVSPLCYGARDGEVTILPKGGDDGPYTIEWNNGQRGPMITTVIAGKYVATITDGSGCTGTVEVDVTQPDSIAISKNTAASKDITCFGGSDGILGVSVIGGNTGGVTKYEWSSGGVTTHNTPVADKLKAGNYTVVYTDSKGCTGTLVDLALLDPPPVQGDYLDWDELKCNGDETTLRIDTIFGGKGGPYQYSLDFGVPLNKTFLVTMGGGTHYITYYDSQQCSVTDTIEVVEPEPIVVTFDPPVIEIQLGDKIVLQPVVTGITNAPNSIVWNPRERLIENDSTLNPTAYPFESETFGVVVTDENNCTGRGTVTVNVDPNRNVYIPNIFKPGNPEGTNDFFNIRSGVGVEMVKFFRVYDRWGSLLYSRDNFDPADDNISTGWDGTYQGKYVNPGVYIYVAEVTFLDGRVLVYRGDVTVLR